MNHDTETLRAALHDIHRASRAELANLPLSAAPMSRFEALTYQNAERRGAIERATDDSTKLIGEARATIHACNARIEREERAEAERQAAEDEARARKLALVG